MSPDLQILKEKALMHKGWRDAMLVDPSTILALIEENERQASIIRMTRDACNAAIGKGICHGADHWRNALVALHTNLSTALEGVKP